MENQIIYKESFTDLVKEGLAENIYIGSGNPNAKILFVGREKSIEANEIEVSSAEQWQEVFDGKRALPPRNYEKNVKGRHTWVVYQELHNYIFPEHKKEGYLNFEERIFTTEMNINPSKKTKDASKKGMEERKKNFFTKENDFIQEFPVVVLACSNYIQPQEIYDIFDVTWQDGNPHKKINNQNKFYAHFNDDNAKLVIHTSQLSSYIRTELLQEMGDVIREFLQKIKSYELKRN